MGTSEGYVPTPFPKHCYSKDSEGKIVSRIFTSPEDIQAEVDGGAKWFESPGEAFRGKANPAAPTAAPAVDQEKEDLKARIVQLEAEKSDAAAKTSVPTGPTGPKK